MTRNTSSIRLITKEHRIQKAWKECIKRYCVHESCIALYQWQIHMYSRSAGLQWPRTNPVDHLHIDVDQDQQIVMPCPEISELCRDSWVILAALTWNMASSQELWMPRLTMVLERVRPI